MSYHVKREHLIGDKRVPYELPCEPQTLDVVKQVAAVVIVTPSGMRKAMKVRADQVYFKLEAV